MTNPTTPRWPELPSRSRGRIGAETRAEVSAWIDERTAELTREGVGAHEARRRALAEFGDVDGAVAYAVAEAVAVERRSRWSRWLEEWWGDATLAARSLGRSPLLTAVLLLTFGLGVGATTAVFSAVRAVLLRPLPVRDEGSVWFLRQTENGIADPVGQLSTSALLALRERTRTLDGVAGLASGGYTYTGEGEPERLPGARVTANTFELLGVRPALGRTFVRGEDSTGNAMVVVLSDALWRRRFGADPAVIGRSVKLNDEDRRIIGVMPPGFFVPLLGESEIWAPLEVDQIARDPNRAAKFRFLHLLARGRPDASRSAISADVAQVMTALQRENPDAFAGIGAEPVAIREAITGEVRPALVVLMGAALFVLLIACANVAGVLVARTIARRHELAVRAALGAGRWRIVRQLATEALTLAIAGGAVGVVLAVGGVRALRLIAQQATPDGITIGVDSGVLLFGLVATVGAGLLLGVLPAVASRATPDAGLRENARRGGTGAAGRRTRRALVVAQLACSAALLVGAGLLMRSLATVASLDLGYRLEHVLTFNLSLPGSRYDTAAQEDQFWAALYPELAAIPGVTVVASAGDLPLYGGAGASLYIDGKPTADGRLPEVRYSTVSDAFFSALSIPLLAGRTFGPADVESAPGAVVISQSAARKFWGGSDPVGSRVRLGPNPAEPLSTVIGVVGDIRRGIDSDPLPSVYVSNKQDHWGGGSVYLRANGDPALLEAAARAAVRRVDPALAVTGMATMEATRERLLGDRRLPMQLMMAFAVVALVLSLVGVYGVMAHGVAARAREFGIRMALGATPRAVLRVILREGTATAALGLLVGTPLALVLAWRLRGMLYQVRPFDPATLGAVAVLLGVVTLVAALVPARRATRVDPAVTLRED